MSIHSAVSDKTPWTDVHRVRMTVQHIQERAATLQRDLASPEEREKGGGGEGAKTEGVGVPYITTTNPPSLSPSPSSSSTSTSSSLMEPPVVCSSLPSSLQLVELVHTHHMQRLEKAVLEFCVQDILPQIKTCSDGEERSEYWWLIYVPLPVTAVCIQSGRLHALLWRNDCFSVAST